MVDLTQTPKKIAVALINDANGTSYTDTTLSLGTPAVNSTLINGLNTSITVNLAGTTQSLGAVVQYNRLSLKTLLCRPYCQLTDGNYSRIADLLAEINSKYLLNLTTTDIVDGAFRPDDVATGIRKITLPAAANHFVYTDSAVLYLGDPDVIEDWFGQTQYQIAADYNTLTFMGGTYQLPNQVVTDISQSVAQRNGISGLYLAPNGQVKLASTLSSNAGQLLARFKNNRLCEVLGLNGETSYDSTGALLPKVPTIPTAVANIPETLGISAALNSGVLSYSLSLDVSTKKAAVGTAYYVDGKAGSDLNAGTTADQAFKTFRRALAMVPAARIIRVKGYSDYYYDADVGWITTVSNRTLDVVAYGDVKPIFTSTRQVTDWINQQDNVWYTTGNDYATVVDKTKTDTGGGYTRFTAAATLASCATTPGSTFYDSSVGRFYVNLKDGRKPDTSVFLIVKTLSGSVADQSQVYLENLVFDMTYSGFLASMTVPKTYGYLYINTCTFGWSATAACLNSYGFNVINQDSVGQYGYAGGFRYWSDRILPTYNTTYWVIENGCTVQYCGGNGLHTSSASWLGALGTMVRINGVYSYCDGDHVQDSGDKSVSLNLGLSSSNVTNVLNTLAHYTAGVNSINSAAAQYWSCTHDATAFSYLPKGVADVALFDTDIGFKPATSMVTPYRFLYTA